MDHQLKQRLIGASVVVAIAVIVIPEFVNSPVEVPAEERVNVEQPTLNIDNGQQSATLAMPGTEPIAGPPAPELEPLDELPIAPELTEPLADTMLEELPEPVADPEVSSFEQTAPQPRDEQPRSTPKPQRLPPTEQLAKAAAPKPQAPAPQAPAPQAPQQTNEVKLPEIKLISRAQYAAADNNPQSVEKKPRWMVQTGSFYVSENASLMREKLRQQSFAAVVQTAVVDGRTVYRVRVGPHATRAEGERTKARLSREAGINGSIVPVYN